MATLSDRLGKLEAATVNNAGKYGLPASMNAVRGEDRQRIVEAMQSGYWDRLYARPDVAEIYRSREITAEQGIVIASIARDLMATEPPDENDSCLTLLRKI